MSSASCAWHEYWDERSRCLYYYNSLDGSSQWERPVDRHGQPLPFLPFAYPQEISQRYSVEDDDIESGLRGVHQEGQSSYSVKGQQANRRRSGRTIDDRSEDDDDNTLRHDYVGMARTYKLETLYREKSREVKCILCFTNLCGEVFFPCEHMCVCSPCIRKEHLCSESNLTGEDDFCHCPLCHQVIKLIVPFEQGKEVERYWTWVYQVTPPLPKGFLRGFRHSAAVIQKVYIDERGDYSGGPVIQHRKRRESNGSCSIT